MSSKSLIKGISKQSFSDVKKNANSHTVLTIDKDKQTPLHLAAQYKNIDIIKLLIHKKANINATDLNGWTPLHCAADKGNLEVCEALMESKNVDICAVNNDEQTAFFYLIKQTKRNVESNTDLYYSILSRFVNNRNFNINEKIDLVKHL